MKVTKETLYDITADFITALNSFDTADMAYIKSLSEIGQRWEIWHRITDNRRNDNSHPRWAYKDRILPYTPGFDSYPDDTNDDTLDTALRAAYKAAKAFNPYKPNTIIIEEWPMEKISWDGVQLWHEEHRGMSRYQIAQRSLLDEQWLPYGYCQAILCRDTGVLHLFR